MKMGRKPKTRTAHRRSARLHVDPAPGTDIQLESSSVDGRVQWRQPSARNEYNPQGLSLAAIDMELSAAFGPQGDQHSLVVFQMVEIQKNIKDRADRALRDKNIPVTQVDNTGKVISDGAVAAETDFDEILKQRWLALPLARHLVQSGDDEVAKLIQVNPLALLQSPQVQDAMCRWLYAVRWCRDQVTRNRAKGLIEISLPGKPGAPPKVKPDLPKLLAAYDDLCRYCRIIFSAAKTLKSKEELLITFSDLPKLVPHFRTRDSGQFSLEDIIDAGQMKPPPSEVAVSYIAAFCGLSASRMTDLIGKARADDLHR